MMAIVNIIYRPTLKRKVYQLVGRLIYPREYQKLPQNEVMDHVEELGIAQHLKAKLCFPINYTFTGKEQKKALENLDLLYRKAQEVEDYFKEEEAPLNELKAKTLMNDFIESSPMLDLKALLIQENIKILEKLGKEDLLGFFLLYPSYPKLLFIDSEKFINRKIDLVYLSDSLSFIKLQRRGGSIPYLKKEKEFLHLLKSYAKQCNILKPEVVEYLFSYIDDKNVEDVFDLFLSYLTEKIKFSLRGKDFQEELKILNHFVFNKLFKILRVQMYCKDFLDSQILEALKEGPASPSEIAEKIKVNVVNAQNYWIYHYHQGYVPKREELFSSSFGKWLFVSDSAKETVEQVKKLIPYVAEGRITHLKFSQPRRRCAL